MDSLRSYYPQFATFGNSSSYHTTSYSAYSSMAERVEVDSDQPPTEWDLKISDMQKQLEVAEAKKKAAERILKRTPTHATSLNNKKQAEQVLAKAGKAIEVLKAKKRAEGHINNIKKLLSDPSSTTGKNHDKDKDTDKDTLKEKEKEKKTKEIALLNQAWDSIEEYSKHLFDVVEKEKGKYTPTPTPLLVLDPVYFSVSDLKVDRDLDKWLGLKSKKD